jgi:hypothetical protein
VSSETNVTGPTGLEAVLPQPTPRRPFFGESHLPAVQEEARKRFYRDVAVLAFPTPSQAYRIADIDDKALYQRAPYSSQEGVKPFLPALADYPIVPAGARVAGERILNLTSYLSSDGRLVWQVPAGNWTILRFGRASTGQNTRPAPYPGLGLECDKFDPIALDGHFQAFVEPLLRELGRPNRGGAGWTMLHMDSWEMSSQNWTADFPEQFRTRRGYDLQRYLPVLTGRAVDGLEVSERFLWDLRQTAQELVVTNHAMHLRELAHRRGLGLSIEPYDMNPCADLTLGEAADVPMCEFWARGFGFNTDYSCFEAVSIAHTLARPIVAAESFTSLDRERWLLYPGALKAQGDWAFCAGVNRLVIHRYQHQPWLDRWPGMTMADIGVHWERTQTWWDLSAAYHLYLARCQSLLRRGLPVADICYLVAEGAPHVFRPPISATRGDPPERREYNFDGCASEVLLERVSMKNGRLVLPDGMSYCVLVLPKFDTMTPKLLSKIKQLVADGATVIGDPPRKSPGLSGYPNCDAEVLRLSEELWGGITRPTDDAGSQSLKYVSGPVERRFGNGRIVWAQPTSSNAAPSVSSTTINLEIYPSYDQVKWLLNISGVPPDFESDGPLRYTHRADGKTQIYFVANSTNQPVDARATFRVDGLQPEWWDPVSVDHRDLPRFSFHEGRTTVPLHFEPYESAFVVFRKRGRRSSADGDNRLPVTTVTEISGPWEMAFQPGRGAPERLTSEALFDWSKDPDPRVHFFSGIATYTTHFDWNPHSVPGMPGTRLFLDLGLVEVMAGVQLNGQDLGIVWTAPPRLEATKALKAGSNRLVVRVANLWPNRLIGDASPTPDDRLTWTTWNPLTSGTPLLSSGLLGPVRVVMERQPGARAAN